MELLIFVRLSIKIFIAKLPTQKIQEKLKTRAAKKLILEDEDIEEMQLKDLLTDEQKAKISAFRSKNVARR